METDNKLPSIADMTLRDWFATAALAGMLTTNADRPCVTTARNAYEYADAMLEERKE